ncbi:MAG TPA: hypothetical protein VFX11_09615 [Candidatus Kapabacteria bacterium]|nr:hypothetical protein [Candidatus Kapabacteria bacterium]
MRGLVAAFLLILVSLPLRAETWELARSDETRNIRVYLRDVPHSSYKSFYAVTQVRTRLSSVVAVLSDVPAMPEWIARMKAVKLLRRNADSELWVHARYRLPYPFLEREAVLYSVMKQDPRTKVVTITTRSVPGFVRPQKDRLRLINMHSTWKLTPEKNGDVRIEFWGQGEPGGYVPPLLFNYNLPDEPVQTLRNLRQMLTRDKYQKRELHYIREP